MNWRNIVGHSDNCFVCLCVWFVFDLYGFGISWYFIIEGMKEFILEFLFCKYKRNCETAHSFWKKSGLPLGYRFINVILEFMELSKNPYITVDYSLKCGNRVKRVKIAPNQLQTYKSSPSMRRYTYWWFWTHIYLRLSPAEGIF